ncbi:MAG: ATP-binding protein [Planctomycetes bacterium]|nr:ATP-binding protein [Planctomycetota bacterium]
MAARRFAASDQSLILVDVDGVFPVKTPSMFTRRLRPPEQSFFLLGARATGKTTWIQQHFPKAENYDLLLTDESLRLSREPGLLRAECAALPDDAWIVIDEVQRVPALLDEVQYLMTKKRQRFVLSGSSARKLKRSGVNLLAGRAELRQMFPLVSAETGFDRALDAILTEGMLPMAVTGRRPAAFLRAYCDTYLKEEVQQEALVRQIGPFHRFLEVAARVNGQTVNVTGIARDAGIARQTASQFFQILVDTLLGTWLPAWKLKRAVKQIAHPKFYLFDPGVARQLAGTAALDLHPEERGALIETFLLHELRAFLHYSELEYPIAYWQPHGGNEVDFVIETRAGLLAIEAKAGTRWDPRFAAGIHSLRERVPDGNVKAIGVYSGPRALVVDDVRVLPWQEFLGELWAGRLIPA